MIHRASKYNSYFNDMFERFVLHIVVHGILSATPLFVLQWWFLKILSRVGHQTGNLITGAGIRGKSDDTLPTSHESPRFFVSFCLDDETRRRQSFPDTRFLKYTLERDERTASTRGCLCREKAFHRTEIPEATYPQSRIHKATWLVNRVDGSGSVKGDELFEGKESSLDIWFTDSLVWRIFDF